MQLRKTFHRPGYQINIAPLIDVVFLLIVFFLVVSQFTRIEVEAINLPDARSEMTGETARPRPVIVNIDPDGVIRIAGAAHSVGSFGYLLQEEIARQGADSLSVLIRADRQCHWQTVREIMAQCARKGIHRVKVAAVKDENTGRL